MLLLLLLHYPNYSGVLVRSYPLLLRLVISSVMVHGTGTTVRLYRGM